MRISRWLEGLLLTALAALLFRYPAESAQGVRAGLALCRDLLIPALFPFFMVSSLAVSTGLAGQLARPLDRLIRPVLGVGGPGTAALLLGLVGGYPVGMQTLAQLRTRGDCGPAEARRTALFCNNCGPAFFLGAAGMGVFASRQAGLLLLAANTLAALGLGIGLRLVWGSVPESAPPTDVRRVCLAQVFPDCVRSAFSSVLGVCGYVLVFSVLTALAQRTGLLDLCQRLLLFPGPQGAVLARSLIVGLLEISTGTAALGGASGCPAALPLAAFLLGWGGLSVHGQSLPFLVQAGGRAGPYLAAKLVQGLLAAGLTVLLLRCLPLSLPAMAPLVPFAAPTLPGRELTALWGLSGGYFFLSRRKRGGKTDGIGV